MRDSAGGRAQLVAGCFSIALAAMILQRPFNSGFGIVVLVGAAFWWLGLLELLEARTSTAVRKYAAALGLAVCGTFSVLWPQHWVYSVAVCLVVWGLGVVYDNSKSGRVRLRGSIAGFMVCLLAWPVLSWPGVTVFTAVVALLCSLLWRGAWMVFSSVIGTRARMPRNVSRIGLLVGATIAVIVVVSTPLIERYRPLQTDEFYDAVPVTAEPGTLVHAELLSVGSGAAVRVSRILYSTRGHDGQPVLASGLFMAPTVSTNPEMPLIVWAHGTAGIARGCAPSLNFTDEDTATAVILRLIARTGWAVVAPDYPGLGTPGVTPYAIGEASGRAVLDAARAAQQMLPREESARAVIWGYSQGGHAALWAGALAPSYAPDIELAGIATLAPAGDLIALAARLDRVVGGAIFAAYVIETYSRVYPDVEFADYVRVPSRLVIRDLARSCAPDPEFSGPVLEALIVGNRFFRQRLADGPLGSRLRANTLASEICPPVLIAHGRDDEIVPSDVQSAYVAAQRAVGTRVDYRLYERRDHSSLVTADSPALVDLVRWTVRRFDAEPARCG